MKISDQNKRFFMIDDARIEKNDVSYYEPINNKILITLKSAKDVLQFTCEDNNDAQKAVKKIDEIFELDFGKSKTAKDRNEILI